MALPFHYRDYYYKNYALEGDQQREEGHGRMEFRWLLDGLLGCLRKYIVSVNAQAVREPRNHKQTTQTIHTVAVIRRSQ